MEIVNENMSKLVTNNIEKYLLGDFNINSSENSNFISYKSIVNIEKFFVMIVKSYVTVCPISGLKN